MRTLVALGLAAIAANTSFAQGRSGSSGSSSSGFGSSSFGSGSSGSGGNSFGSSQFGSDSFGSSSFGSGSNGSGSGMGSSGNGSNSFGNTGSKSALTSTTNSGGAQGYSGNSTMQTVNNQTSTVNSSTSSGGRGSSRGGVGSRNRIGASSGFGNNSSLNRKPTAIGPQVYVRPAVQVQFERPTFNPSDIVAAVTPAFASTAMPGAAGVKVQMGADGVATITGSVATQNDRKVAEAMLLLEPGVRSVQNQITVSTTR